MESQDFINNNSVTKKLKYKYIGIALSSDCSWNAHIKDVILKTARVVNIQRWLKCSQPHLKTTAYLACVGPIKEYAWAIWGPTQRSLIDKVGKHKKSVARFVL